MAALRLGMAFTSQEIIGVLNKIKYPYNINKATQQLALKALGDVEQKNQFVNNILLERKALIKQLESFNDV